MLAFAVTTEIGKEMFYVRSHQHTLLFYSLVFNSAKKLFSRLMETLNSSAPTPKCNPTV